VHRESGLSLALCSRLGAQRAPAGACAACGPRTQDRGQREGRPCGRARDSIDALRAALHLACVALLSARGLAFKAYIHIHHR
jgi:hypothetical protein